MRALSIAVAAAFALLAACTSTVTTTNPTTGATTTASVSWTPTQTAWFVLNVGIAAENEAAAAKNTPGVSPLLAAEIKTGMVSLSNGLQASATSLETNGSVGASVLSAAESAALAAVQQLTTLLTSAKGSTATPLQIAISAGLDALGQVASLAPVYAQLKSGYQPAASDLAAAVTALNTAAAQ